MSHTTFYYGIVYPWIGVAVIIFFTLFFITAPYGRHIRAGWGWTVDNRWSWFWMEIVSPAVFGYFFLSGSQTKTTPMWIFFALWWFHYLNRSLIFPLRLQTQGKRVPLMIPLSAVFFNSVNGFINGYYLGTLADPYPESWLTDPRFVIGILMFLGGWWINVQSDEILLKLRKPGETGYKIPRGGMYRYISNPNYFGEMVEWTGFALMTWSLPALAFSLWTIANLAPRAWSNHRWYQRTFTDYPKERKALIPFVV